MNKDINQHMLELLEQAKHGAVLYDDLIDYICEHSFMDEKEKEAFGFTGHVTSDVLNKLLEAENGAAGLALADWAVNHFAGENTIDRKAFKRILSLKGRVGNSIIMGLDHAPLSFYQLFELSKRKRSGMVLDILLPMLFEYDCFTVYDVEEVMENTKASIYSIKGALDFSSKYKDTEKYKVAERAYIEKANKST